MVVGTPIKVAVGVNNDARGLVNWPAWNSPFSVSFGTYEDLMPAVKACAESITVTKLAKTIRYDYMDNLALSYEYGPGGSCAMPF